MKEKYSSPTIGNVLNDSVKNIWLTKGVDVWQSDAVKNFVASIDEDKQTSALMNHVDTDIAL